ncbi:hypothetical protein EDB19DRAFT_1278767 [Suillus lakei]|nr:hypothetical protein EDB19DRAFT_1278767 [Suillus lakei]
MSSQITYCDVEVFCPPDWALWISTGPGIGTIYQIVGDQDTYTLDIRRNQPKATGRPMVFVGCVAPHWLSQIETNLTSIPVTRHDPDWNTRDWVWKALCNLRFNFFERAQGISEEDRDNMMATIISSR